MKIDLNKMVSMFIVIVGFVLFILNAINNFAVAFILITLMLLGWMLWEKITHRFQLTSLLYLIACSGLLVSITILCLYGIEPVGTREGILMRFHSDGIAAALGILVFTLLPVIIFNLKFDFPTRSFNINLNSMFNKVKNLKTHKRKHKDQYIINDDNWELASKSDVTSNKYNIE